MSRPCEVCGQAFDLKWSTSEQRFCSRACARAGRSTVELNLWSDAELGHLTDLDGLTAVEAAAVLGRTAQSVQHMRSKIKSGWTWDKEHWSQDDDDFIRRTPDFTAAQVAQHLGRTSIAVSSRRKKLADDEGLSFGRGQKKRPDHVAGRRLLAKTCLGCGLLLDARWFAVKQGRKWQSRCSRCLAGAHPATVTTYKKDGGRSARASAVRMQELTRPHAHRHGQPWVDADHSVLRDPDLTAFEKALKLGRTWAAVHAAVKANGYTSRVGKGDPMHGVWRIHNPNAPRLVGAA